jgi:hypothetical protein
LKKNVFDVSYISPSMACQQDASRSVLVMALSIMSGTFPSACLIANAPAASITVAMAKLHTYQSCYASLLAHNGIIRLCRQRDSTASVLACKSFLCPPAHAQGNEVMSLRDQGRQTLAASM